MRLNNLHVFRRNETRVKATCDKNLHTVVEFGTKSANLFRFSKAIVVWALHVVY